MGVPIFWPLGPRIFVSHSHTDNAYCREFVAALRRTLTSNDAVWYDEHNLGWGSIRSTIERELEQRQHFIAILSPAAVKSHWVNSEIDAALELLHEHRMQTISFVTAEKCRVPLLLRSYKRVELAGGDGYPPADAAAKVLHIIKVESESITGTTGTTGPRPAVRRPDDNILQMPVLLPYRQPSLSTELMQGQPLLELEERKTPPYEPKDALAAATTRRDLFPERLQRLGFTAWTAKDPATGKPTALILPPLCPIPAGPFLMGSDPQQDHGAQPDEQPQHKVILPAYQISKFPVTVAEYAYFIVAGHAEPPEGRGDTDWHKQLTRLDHPVTCVSWHDATAYAAWLARLTGQSWKLPSEAEWEKAARWDAKGNDEIGTARIYPWGDRFDRERCNTSEANIKTTTPVGSYTAGASPCGAEDMVGNVWECTSSLFWAYPYSTDDDREDPRSSANRVIRGGSWLRDLQAARTACRNDTQPGHVNESIGFRVALLSAAPTP